MIAYKSIIKGLNKLMVNKSAIDNDLNNNWMVIAEGIQTILRREGVEGAYEALKKLTRTNKIITKEDIHAFIDELNVSDSVKRELKSLSPFNYTGK